MRYTISIPDVTFERVSQHVVVLGMSRSEFFNRAAERYLADLDRQAIVDRIDGAIESAGGADTSNGDAVQAGRRTLHAANEEW